MARMKTRKARQWPSPTQRVGLPSASSRTAAPSIVISAVNRLGVSSALGGSPERVTVGHQIGPHQERGVLITDLDGEGVADVDREPWLRDKRIPRSEHQSQRGGDRPGVVHSVTATMPLAAPALGLEQRERTLSVASIGVRARSSSRHEGVAVHGGHDTRSHAPRGDAAIVLKQRDPALALVVHRHSRLRPQPQLGRRSHVMVLVSLDCDGGMAAVYRDADGTWLRAGAAGDDG